VLLRSGNGKWHLAFFLLRTFVRIDPRRHFISGATCHRTSSKEQGRQYEQNQRSRVSGSWAHALDSTHDRARRTRTRIKEFDAVQENPLAMAVPTSTVVAMRIHVIFAPLSTCHNRRHAERSRQGVSSPFDISEPLVSPAKSFILRERSTYLADIPSNMRRTIWTNATA
jgi:hypothetical protein